MFAPNLTRFSGCYGGGGCEVIAYEHHQQSLGGTGHTDLIDESRDLGLMTRVLKFCAIRFCLAAFL